MAQRKVALVIGYGQSNEQGVGVNPRVAGVAISPTVIANNVRHQSVFGPPVIGLTAASPAMVSMSSMFQKLAEHLALETGWAVRYANNCVGGQACTDSWVGWDSTNNRLKQIGESGYDPTGYIAGFLSNVTSAVAAGYEVWTITAGHQNDVNNTTHPVSSIIAASVHVQQRAIAAGASKVFVGITPRYIGSPGEANWNTGGTYPQIQQGVLAGIPGSLVGADLSGNLDTKLCATDNQQFIHLNHAGTCWAAEKWLKAFKAAGVI
jgi:hypothetical protein